MSLNKLILKQSSALTIIGVIFQIFGLLFMLLVAKKFGANAQIDGYYYIIAFHFFIITIIQNVFKIVLLPILITERTINPDQINLLFNNLFFLISSFAVILSIILIVLASSGMLQFFFPKSLDYDYYKDLFILSSPLILLNVSSSILINIYNSFQKFWILELINNSKFLINLVFFYFFFDLLHINSLVLGNILGQLFILGFFIFYLSKTGIVSFKFNLKIHDSLGKITRLSFIPFLSTIIVAFQPLIINFFLLNTNISGSISLFNYSQKIASIPTVIFSAGMLTVFVSHISLLEANGNGEGIKNTTSKSVSFLFSFLLPIIAFIYWARYELISFLFKSDVFSKHQLTNISNTTTLLLVSLVFLQIHSLISRIFIAKQNTKLLFILSVIGSLLQILLIYVFVKKIHLIEYGIPVSIVITNFVILLLSIIYSILKYDLLNIKYILRNLLLSTLISISSVFLLSHIDVYIYNFINVSFYIILIKFIFILSFNLFLLYKFKQSDVISLYIFLTNKLYSK